MLGSKRAVVRRVRRVFLLPLMATSLLLAGPAANAAGPLPTTSVAAPHGLTLSQVVSPISFAINPPTVAVEFATLVATLDVNTFNPPLIDPAGIAYLEHAGELLVSDSEVNEEPTVFAGVNLWQMTTTGSVSATGVSPDIPLEPTGLTYDPATEFVYLSNDISDRIYRVDAGVDGAYGTADDIVTSFDVSAFGAIDPEDVAFDTSSGDLFIADGIGSEVFRVNAGPNGVFDGVAPGGDDIVTSFDISGLDIEDAEGIGYRASSDTILVVDAGADDSIFEFTKDGFLLRRIDLAAIGGPGPETPSDVVLAPASAGGGLHLYVVDRKQDNGDPLDGFPPPIDGKIYELSAPFTDLPPYVDAGEFDAVPISAGAQLDGLAVNDGQPSIGSMTTTWSKVSGPGTVSFGNANATKTTATFSEIGTYVLQLAASDTVNVTTDTVEITVFTDPINNTAPQPNAGPDASVVLQDGAVLGGSVIDDGLPDPPGALATAWSLVSGPGSVSFSSPNQLVTTVSFSTVGTYVIRLSADDSELSGTDEVVITVTPNPVTGLTCTNDEFPGAPFVDIGGLSAETVTAIDCLVFYGITKGTSPTTFSPFDNVSRWQMALFLIREAQVLGVSLPDGSDQGFTDIANYPVDVQIAINQLAQLGITQGTAPGVYSPADVVPRWQMALFLTRLLTDAGVALPSGSDQGYVDIGAFPTSTQVAINQVTQLNVAKGVGNLKFDPSSSVTRWQMALFLYRTLQAGGL